mmetsp:Transcript_10876/g.20408  ORF Transcript_10876/g.20408 Transcript_10876/m.20408 type:complete len:229 (+) Transcript_10876:50-736(+)
MGGPAIIDGQEVEHTDNFFVAPFVLDGIEWPTCEHYYQAAKFSHSISDEKARAVIEEIRSTTSGPKTWSLAQKYPHLLLVDWEYIKVNVMYRAVAAKYAQHPEFAEQLAATSGSIRTGMSTADWQRMNRLILERIREELRPVDQRNHKRLEALVSLTEPRAQDDAALRKLRGYAQSQTLQSNASQPSSASQTISAGILNHSSVGGPRVAQTAWAPTMEESEATPPPDS